MDTSKFQTDIDNTMISGTTEQIVRDLLSQHRFLLNQLQQLAFENAEIKTYYRTAVLHMAEMHEIKFHVERMRDELTRTVRKETPHKNKVLDWLGIRKTKSL